MKRKFTADDGASLGNPAKMMLSGSAGDMFQNSYGTPLCGSPLIGKPMSASTPYAETGNRRYAHTASTGAAVLRMQRSPPPGSSSAVAMDAAEAELRRVIDNFVNVYEQLDRTDSPTAKPNYSYTELAFLAMLRAPNFCLPITEIYRYIQTRFLFYKHSTRKHWKNAVRHSLAKTLCFTKIPVGRGASNSEKLARSTYLWCIIPSSISCFARGDYRPNTNAEGDPGTNTLRWGYYNANAEKFWLEVGDYVATKMASFKNLVRESQTPGLVFEAQVCRLPVTSVQGHRQPLQTRNMNLETNPAWNERSQQFGTSNPAHVGPNTGSNLNMRSNEDAYAYFPRDTSQLNNRPTGVTIIGSYNCGSDNPMTSSFDFEDHWLPRFTLHSPDASFTGVDSHRRTPPCTPGALYDSGFETCDSSPNESSCRMFAGYSREPNSSLDSPSLLFDNFNSSILSDGCIGDLNRLSPFSLSDFSEAGPNYNPVNAPSQSQTADDSYGQRAIPSPCMQFQSPPSSMTSGAHYTCRLGAEFNLPPPYPNGPINNRLQPGLCENGEPVGNLKQYSPPSWQQTTGYTSSAPILVINTDGIVTSSAMAHWNAYAFNS